MREELLGVATWLEHIPGPPLFTAELAHGASRLRALAEKAGPAGEQPSGYAYLYNSPLGGTELRFNSGKEVNGGKPIEAVPYWLAAPPSQPVVANVGKIGEPLQPVALPDGITGTLVKIGDSPKGQPRLIVHTTREAIEACGANLLFKRVRVAAAPAGEGVGDSRDAQRYRSVRRGQHWIVIDGIGNTLRGEDLDKAVDAQEVPRG